MYEQGGRTALLIIDVQDALVYSEKPVLYNREGVLENLAFLIACARKNDVPVIYVQHESKTDPDFARGSAGWQIAQCIAPREGEPVVAKRKPDAFYETRLREELNRLGIRRLVIAGMQTDCCVNATVRRAAALGYPCVVAEDAHTTFPRFPFSSQSLVGRYNRIWSRRFTKVLETRAIRF